MTIINTQNFDDSVKSGVTVVDFFATWCGPCTAVAPIIEGIATKYEGKAQVFKLDVDQAPEIAERFRVMSIPSVLFFKDGELKNTIVGAQPESRYTDALEETIK